MNMSNANNLDSLDSLNALYKNIFDIVLINKFKNAYKTMILIQFYSMIMTLNKTIKILFLHIFG
jgi:hypothetical protein